MSVAFGIGLTVLVGVVAGLLANLIFGPITRVPCARGCGARIDLDADKQLAHDRACPNNGLNKIQGGFFVKHDRHVEVCGVNTADRAACGWGWRNCPVFLARIGVTSSGLDVQQPHGGAS